MSTSNAAFHSGTTGSEVVSAFAERVKGRIFLVTGPSPTGIGAATLTSLAKAQPEVLILAGRSPSKFQPVIDNIKSIDANIKVVVVQLDLSSLASTRKAAQELLANPDVPRIDVLINNAAIMVTPYGLTQDGIEQQFHTDHIGPFLFTNLLLPKLRAAKDPVVVNVSSSAHRFGTGDFSDVNWEKTPYDEFGAYGHGKCANVLFAVSLVERGIKAASLHPGWVGTALGRDMTKELLDKFMRLAQAVPNFEQPAFEKNLEQGCSTTLVAALDPKVPGGAYLRDCQVATDVAPQAIDKNNAAKLWELSNKLTGENFP